MIHPSYKDLLTVVNSGAEEGDPAVTSRYSIVLATAMDRGFSHFGVTSGADPLIICLARFAVASTME